MQQQPQTFQYKLTYQSPQGDGQKVIIVPILTKQDAQDWTNWLNHKRIPYQLIAKNF